MSKEAVTPSYVFTAATKTVDLNIASFDIKLLAAIINLTDSIVIYAAGCPDLGYTSVAGDVVTLVYDTTTMSDSDVLQILYYQPGTVTLDAASLAALESINVTLDAGSLSALENITVDLSAGSLAALENITVALDAPSLAALENITVDLSPTSLTALENISIDAIIGEVEIKNDSGNPVPVSASSLPLPTGAATLAEQQTQTTKLTSIDDGIPAALGQTTMANSMPVVLPSDQTLSVSFSGTQTVALDAPSLAALENISVTVTTPTEFEIKNDAGNPIPISDAGGSITVDGPLTDSQLRASSVPVTANAGTNLNTSALNLETTQAAISTKLTDGTQKAIVRGGAKGATTAADVTSTNQSADRQSLDVQIRTSAGAAVDSFGGGSQYSQSTVYNGTQLGTMAMSKYERTDPYIGGLADQSLVPLTVDSTGKLLQNFQGSNQWASLNALNAATKARSGGMSAARFEMTGGVLVGTVTIETSTNNGSSWSACPYIINMQTSARINNGQITANGVYIIYLGDANDSLNITNIRARVSAYTSGSAVGYIQMTSGTEGLYTFAQTQPKKLQTYSAAILNPSTLAATGVTDLTVLSGSATKTIKLLKVGFDFTLTSAAQVRLGLIRRTTANTGGTATTITTQKYDINNDAGTAVAKYYTVYPTLGTASGYLRTGRVLFPTPTTASDTNLTEWRFDENFEQLPTLRGVNESFALFFDTINLTGITGSFYWVWTEE